MGILILAQTALGIGDPAVLARAMVIIPWLFLFVAGRLWLQQMTDVGRARILYGRTTIVLVAACCLGLATRDTGRAQNVSAFVVTRIIGCVVIAYGGFAAVHIHHQLTCCLIIVVVAFFLPPLTELGHPIEPLVTMTLTCLGLLSSALITHLLTLQRRTGQAVAKPDGHVVSTSDGHASYNSHQFQASLMTLCMLLGASCLVILALIVAMPEARCGALVCVVNLVCLIALGTWLHHSKTDQEAACLIFGRGSCVISAADVLSQFWPLYSANASCAWNVPTFLITRLFSLVLVSSGGYSARYSTHQWNIILIQAAGAIFLPALSVIGHAHEVVITAGTLVLGWTVSFSTDEVMRRVFKDQQVEKSLRREAQARALAATERQRESEMQAAQKEREHNLEQQFFALTCHEVRNPLNGTVGCLRLAANLLAEGQSPVTSTSADLLAEGGAAPLEGRMAELRQVIDDAILCADFCLRVLTNMTSLQRLEVSRAPVPQPQRLRGSPPPVRSMVALRRPRQPWRRAATS